MSGFAKNNRRQLFDGGTYNMHATAIALRPSARVPTTSRSFHRFALRLLVGFVREGNMTDFWPSRRLALMAMSGATCAALIPGVVQAQQGPDPKPAIVVFAAASLKTALNAIAAQWLAENGQVVRVSYASSAVLAKQIEQGAPAALFISADLDWMDYITARNLIVPQSRVNLLSNELVLVGPKGTNQPVQIEPGFDLTALLKGGRLAMGLTRSVPAGKYGKAALEALGLWGQVAARLAEVENVRVAVELVARGEAAAGIVYKSDAIAEPRVGIIATFPKGSYPPIIYPAAVINGPSVDAAAGFFSFLVSAIAKAEFSKQGFLNLN